MLMELLFLEEYQKTALYVLPDYRYIHAELAQKGVNLTMLFVAAGMVYPFLRNGA